MNTFLKLLLLSVIVFTAHAKTVTDMDGHPVILPDQTDRVFGSSPPMNYLIYALNPNKMIGLNFAAKNGNNAANENFLNQKFLSLPVIGSFHRGGQSINLETLMAYKPQLVLLWQDDMMVQTVQREIEKTHLPTFMIPFREVSDMPRAFRLAGAAIGENKQANILANYSQKNNR
jgi:iron complex transport system substrate-binding protein